MQNTNNQIQELLDEFKTINKSAINYLKEVDKKIAELDMKYAQQIVKNDINILKAAKSVLLNKNK